MILVNWHKSYMYVALYEVCLVQLAYNLISSDFKQSLELNIVKNIILGVSNTNKVYVALKLLVFLTAAWR